MHIHLLLKLFLVLLLSSCTSLNINSLNYKDQKNNGFPFIGGSYLLTEDFDLTSEVGISRPKDWSGSVSDWVGRSYLTYYTRDNYFIDLGTFYQYTNDYAANQPAIDKSGHRLDPFIGGGYRLTENVSVSIIYTNRTNNFLFYLGFSL